MAELASDRQELEARSGRGNTQSLTCVVTAEELIKELGPPRGTSVILTLDTRISRRIWVTWLSVPTPRHSTTSEHWRWARSRKTGWLQSRREEGEGMQWLDSLQHTLVHLLVLQSTDWPCCCPCSVPSPAVRNVTSHSWDRRRDSPRQRPGQCGSRGNRLWEVPAARGTRRTAPFTAQPLAARRNRQLEFKLDVLCVHED